MAALGFTTVASLLKEQAEAVKAKGIEAYGVSVIDDTEGRCEPIKTSNAQLHLFMQIKRGNITHMVFQSADQANVFFGNIEAYYGKEKAEGILSGLSYISVGDSKDALEAKGIPYSSADSLDMAVSSMPSL